MKLSVVMITKNASDVIEEALKSVEGLWDELLVVDDKSADETRMIIEHYRGKIFTLENKNLGERKQWLVKKAKGDWILVLDSDERLSVDLRNEIQKILKYSKMSRRIAGYNITYQNYVFGKPVYYGGEQYGKIRLFRRGKGKVDPLPIHEEIQTKGDIGELHGVLYHHSYRSLGPLFSKFTHYALEASKEKQKNGEGFTLAKLFFYGPHMFWARYIKEKGYKDGWRGFILAFAFAYMEGLTYWTLFFCEYLNIWRGRNEQVILRNKVS